MKKKYEKPEMFMESFEVAEFIASCQDTGTWQQSREECKYKITFPGVPVIRFYFNDSNNGCDYIPNDDGSLIIDCYNNTVRPYKVFTS